MSGLSHAVHCPQGPDVFGVNGGSELGERPASGPPASRSCHCRARSWGGGRFRRGAVQAGLRAQGRVGSVWWQVYSGCFPHVSDRCSHQRDARSPSVGRPQPPALSWLPCLSRPTGPSPPSSPATSHTRASGFHTSLLGRPCRACPRWPLELTGAGPAPGRRGPAPRGGTLLRTLAAQRVPQA